MPNTIKVKRGKSAALNTSTEKLQAGEILYNLDKNYLTVGAEDNDALTKKPVAAREIVGYTGDTDSKIGTSTTEAYSIKYDTQLKIKDGDNTLLVPKKDGTLATTEDIAAELENYYTKTESDAKYSQATNIENGTGTGSLKQKDPTYDGLVDALKPYNRSYLKSKGYTSSNPTTAKSILVASGLYSSDEAENYITNNGSEPEVIAEALAKGQLKGYHNIEPDTDLSNTVTEAAASSFVMGIQNKAYSPLMFVGGMNCEAGSKNSSSYLISSFTFGRELKNYSLDSIMAGLGTNSYKVIKNQNNAYKGQQRCYLKYLAEAGGQVTGEGDNRVAVTGVNDGPSCVVLGNYHFSKGECNVLLGNQNIINGGDNVAIGLHNYIIGYVHLSACIGVQNVIKGTGSYDCYGNYLIGRSLRLEGGKHRVAVGVSNAKADDASVIFMVGNGDEDASSSETQRRSNAFEVLKDGRAKVQSAPVDDDDIVRKLDLSDAISAIPLDSVITTEMVDVIF